MSVLSTTTLISDGNLEGYWKLDNAYTSSGGQHPQDLSATNSPSFNASGKYNYSLDFGSANTNKNAYEGNTNMNIDGGAISLVGWVKLNTENTTEGAAYTLFSQGSATSHVFYHIDYKYSSGVQYLQFLRNKAGGTEEFVQTAETLGTSNWHHIAMTYDATNTRGYLDGVLIAGPTAMSGNGSTNSNAGYMLGANIVSGPTGSNFGSIQVDDTAIFSRALTLAEIQLLSNDPVVSTTKERYAFFM